MTGFVRGLLFASALALSGAAAAQEAPAKGDDSTIVVTGNTDVESQVRDFVGALTQAPPRGQLSRFEWAVCPAAIGVSPSQKVAIADRMRRIAQAAGIRVGSATCTPNVLLMVADDKRAFMELLERKYPDYFGDLSTAEVRRLEREPGPAVAWQIQGPARSADGVELHGENGSSFDVNRTIAVGSRITPPTRPQFQAAAVLVEKKALEGLTTTQLADYAAMRGFARTDPARLPPNAPTTILKILDAPMGSEVPVTLTEWDLSFLKALYASPPNLYAASQRTDMRRRIQKDLQHPEEPRR
jgi:hypothetical protein